MKKKKKFSLSTAGGSRRLLALALCVIMISSFLACLISSDFGRIKVSHVEFDARGAVIECELYTPAGVSDHDSLPAVAVSHGGNVSNAVMRSIAEEIARRGFVVLNLNSYGCGTSEEPKYDEAGLGVDAYDVSVTPAGLLDGVNYLRTLKYVDKTRIGVVGHSMGNTRSRASAVLDCGFLNYNDQMINILCEKFGQSFTEDEIGMNAQQLAEARLSPDELTYYNYLAEETRTAYDETIHSICLLGNGLGMGVPSQLVNVGGYEVRRNCQTNQIVIVGVYENLNGGWDWQNSDEIKTDWYLNGESAELEEWYAIDDETASSRKLGSFFDVDPSNSAELKSAFENREARCFVMHSKETHSKNFFSVKTTSDVVRYVTESLGYNNGDLGAADAAPLAHDNIIFGWREFFSMVAMFGMFVMLFALAALLTKTKYFKPCVRQTNGLAAFDMKPKAYWIFALATAVLTFVVLHICNTTPTTTLSLNLIHTRFFPLSSSSWKTFALIVLLGIGSLLLFAIGQLIFKRKAGDALKELGLSIGVRPALRSVLLALILLAAAYASLQVILYWFDEVYGIWMVLFLEMRPEYWFIAVRYAIVLVPAYLLIGLGTNSMKLRGCDGWKDTALSVFVSSIGVYVLMFLNFGLLLSTDPYDGSMFSTFITSYGTLLLIPLTAWITRKMYKMTNNIWIGACLNAFLMSWYMVCNSGYYTCYYGQTFIGNLLGG